MNLFHLLIWDNQISNFVGLIIFDKSMRLINGEAIFQI